MSQLPPCPKCNSAFAYEVGDLLSCPECGHEWHAGEAVADEDPVQADIVLCVDVLLKEAAERRLPVAQHAAHLIVHGVLHAQGYDHEDDEEAAEMEGLETEILGGLGFPDPYRAE